MVMWWTAKRSRVAINSTRASRLSSSSATGLAVSVSAVWGHSAPMRRATSPLIAATLSRGSVRETKMPTSPMIWAPLGRKRIASIDATPGTASIARRRRSASPLGAVSTNASIVWRPSRKLAIAMNTATPIAARASAWTKPNRVAAKPMRTRRDQIAGIMQCVRRQRVAFRFSGDLREGAPAYKIDCNRDEDDAKRQRVGVDFRRIAAHTPDRLDGGGDRQHRQKARLRQRRHRFNLRVAERMFFVGWLVGLSHREKRE